MKINLRESLNKIDLATDNKYDLLNTFDSKKLSDNSKKKLAEAIENNSIASINRVLHESKEQLYKVVIQSGATKRDFESALYEDEAEGIIDYYGGRWIDENGFEWDMYIEEDDDSIEHAIVDEEQSFESLKEDFDDEYESDFDDNEVEEGNHVFADGEEYVWVERIAGPIYLDFDKWAVWSARVFVDPRDFMTIHSDGKNYDFDGDAFKKKAMAAPIVYFVVEEDTGFIDWGPVESRIEAQDFLNGKQEDWDNDEYYGESLEKNLDEWYVHTLHYEDIGDGREYDYEVDHEEVLDYLSEIAIDEEDAPEDTEEYLKWVEDNFDELFNKYEYEIEEHFREDASQEEYNRRHSSYES